MELRTINHPRANGREPVDGEHEYTLTVTLESGERLDLKMGDAEWTELAAMAASDAIDRHFEDKITRKPA